jgi:hypothetical protein
MINYILLVSRQGSCATETTALDRNVTEHDRQGPTCEMVLDDGAESQGQDCEGCYPAGSG